MTTSYWDEIYLQEGLTELLELTTTDKLKLVLKTSPFRFSPRNTCEPEITSDSITKNFAQIQQLQIFQSSADNCEYDTVLA